MAKRIEKRDLIDEGALLSINKDAALLLKTLQGIGQTINTNLAASKEFFTSFKAMDSAGLKAFNAEVQKTNSLIIEKQQLDLVESKLAQQIAKEYEAEAKLINQLNKNKQQEVDLADKAIKRKMKQIEDEKKANSIYAQQSKTLNELRKQYKDLALAEGESSKQAKALLKEITTLDAKLKKVDASVGQFQRNVGNYSQAIRGIGRNVAGVLGVGVGVAQIGSFINQSTQDFKEFDKNLKEVSAITGLVGEKLEFFKQAALEAGQEGSTSAKEYLEAIKLIGSASPQLLEDAQALKAVTDEAIILKQAAGIDLPTAAGALTASMNQFQLPATDAKRLINALAAGSKEGSAEVNELTESFKNVGTVANESNLTFEETVTYLELMAERQLKGAEAGTKLRGVIAQLKKNMLGFGSGKFNLNDALTDARNKLNAIKDPAERAAKEIKLFGVENQTAGLILLDQQKKFDVLREKVTGTNTAYEQAAINQSSAAAESERLNNQLEAARIEIGENLVPVLNSLKAGLIGVIQFVSELFAGFNEMTDAVKANGKAFNDLKESYETGKINFFQYTKGAFTMSEAFKELKNSTKETQKEGEELIRQFQAGEMHAGMFAREVEALRQRELKRRQQQKKINDEVKAETGATNGVSAGDAEAENIKKASKAKDEAFEKEKNQLELRKTNAEIFINTTVEDEKERVRQLSELNIDYLAERAIIEKTYGKDYRKTVLERVNAEIADEKRRTDEAKAELQKRIEIQKQIDQLEVEAIQDPREREKRLAQLQLEDKLATIQGETEKENELREALYLEYRNKLKEIDAKYDKEAADEKQRQKDEQDQKDKEAEEKRKEERKKFLNDTLDMIEEEVKRENELKIDQLNDEIERRESNIDRQMELAEKGLTNQLLFEKKALDDAKLREKKEKEDQIREEQILGFFKAYAAYAAQDPATALQKAARDTVAAKIIAAAFYEGTKGENIAEDLGKPLFSGRDGYVVRVDGSEKVFNGMDSALIPKGMTNKEVAKLAHDYGNGKLMPSYIGVGLSENHLDSPTKTFEKSVKEFGKKIDEVKQEIRQKPVFKAEFNAIGEYIETRIKDGLKQIKVTNARKKFSVG